LPSNKDYDRVEKSVRKRLVSKGVEKGYNFELPPVIGISIGGSRKSLADLIDEVKARCNEVPIEEKFIVR